MVKKYELPQQKPERDGGDIVSQGLKYIGIGGLARGGEDTADAGQASADGDGGAASRVTSRPGMSSWVAGLGRATPGEPSQRQRKKSVAEEQEEEDDRHIRFKIGGVGQRMTKQAFIEEMKKLDRSTRREVVDQSSASYAVKTLAKQDPSTQTAAAAGPSSSKRGKDVTAEPVSTREAPTAPSSAESSASTSRSSSTSAGRGRVASRGGSPSHDAPETAVERRRRLAVLESVDGGDDTTETPAEKRRREAALGVSGHAAEDDSDDDDTPRLPSARRGIRFADTPDKREG